MEAQPNEHPVTVAVARRTPRRSVRVGLGALVVTMLVLPVARADWLVVKTRKGKVKFTGRITHMDDRKVEIMFPSGEKKSYARERILAYQAEVPKRIEVADRLFKEGKFAEAAVHYERARQDQVLSWLWRRSLGRLIACYRGLGENVRAADTLLELIEEFPLEAKEARLGLLPLVWTRASVDAAMRSRAQAWLREKGRGVEATRAAHLLAASVLISAGQGAQAVPILDQLRSAGPVFAEMAAVQAWRVHLSVDGLADRVRQWRGRVSGLNEAAQPGAHYVLGQAYEILGDVEGASLSYMHVVILYAPDVTLASLACLRAGQLLQKLGRQPQAEALFQEVIRRFRATPAGAEAEKVLRTIRSTPRGRPRS